MSQFLPSTVKTLVDLLLYRTQQQKTQIAYQFLIDGEAETEGLTYQDLYRYACAIAVKLQSQYTPGNRILLLYQPGLDYIAAFLGCLYAGMIAVPAYPPRLNRSLHRLQSILADCDAAAILTTQQIRLSLETSIQKIHEFTNLHWITTDSDTLHDWDSWHPPPIRAETLAFLQYTSGSTSVPKGVMISHRNLLHNLQSLHQCFEISDQSSGVIWLPPFHDMGLIGGILQPLYSGFPVTLMSPLMFIQRPFRWLNAISTHRATISGGPNFAYDLCVKKITSEQKENLDLSCWELAFNGAEPINPHTLEQFSAAFAPCGFQAHAFYPCYGMAETTLIATGGKKQHPPIFKTIQSRALGQNVALPLEHDGQESRTLVGCGQSLPDQRIIIVNPETRLSCAEHEVGEIWVQGPSVAAGYWNRDSLSSFHGYLADNGFKRPAQKQQKIPTDTTANVRITAEKDEMGPFLRTGDLGFLSQGELFCTGRMKDVIVIHGANHYPQDIEWTIEDECYACLRAGCIAVFAVLHNNQEQVVVLAEVERSYLNPDKHSEQFDKIIRALRQKIWQHHQLSVHQFVLIRTGTLPKTSSGKIQRHQCQESYLAGTLACIHTG
ncbi:fatty acyl-AMP ligase [Lyngbya confervoides]|uniref:Fatty acyl-AMP ligase n=1 Tax=Lyngbya confervoides BDU141951 TaxID=1574623 RepID=A0ABD4T8C4_9CYAN|nr:fatty acyl-AMP ligase [Lyngbya confervoides]MCM1984978.1 fatty acyl-AMP ligase [Lyngbya confervoides BDU141951]